MKMTFDAAKLRELKAAYATAQMRDQTVFTFHGRPLLVSYAKYMIEYLGDKLRAEPESPSEADMVRGR